MPSLLDEFSNTSDPLNISTDNRKQKVTTEHKINFEWRKLFRDKHKTSLFFMPQWIYTIKDYYQNKSNYFDRRFRYTKSTQQRHPDSEFTRKNRNILQCFAKIRHGSHNLPIPQNAQEKVNTSTSPHCISKRGKTWLTGLSCPVLHINSAYITK